MRRKNQKEADRPFQQDFGKFIRDGRERLNLNQTQVAEALEITQQYYSHIEIGDRAVDFAFALQICRVLKLNIEDFIRSYLD